MSVATTLPNKPIRILAMLVSVVLFAGCSAVSGGLKSPTILPTGPSALAGGSKIGKVAIVLDEEQLTPAVAEVAKRYEVERILGNRVLEQVTTRGMLGSSGLEVEVAVVGMRLRSNGTAIWWGVMAGGDWITVDVKVSKNGKLTKRFQTGTGTSLGGMVFGGRSVRVGRMMKTLAIRITDGI